jgi:CubicO group peptidase (beta-lactamase class C family)
MTKMITAATVLRMTEEEKYQQFLPKGIEAKLSDLLPLLKKHYPDSTYIQTQLELQPNFGDITLQHLAWHTSGLARVESGAFRDANRKLTPDEMIDAAKKPKTGEFGERVGEYFYNDLGYELLGRVIVAVDSEQRGRVSMFGDVVDELVISRVREKAGEEKKELSVESLRLS